MITPNFSALTYLFARCVSGMFSHNVRATSFLKIELRELELVMVSRFAKWVPPSCSLFVAYRLYIVYRQVF